MRTIDAIRTTAIEKVVKDSSNIKSFYFRDKESLSSLPGQFVMIWLPDHGEFPMSLSLSKNGFSCISVKAMGEGSKKLYERERGDIIGIRGPYGNSFSLPKKGRVLLVGGGTGMAPLVFFARELAKSRIETNLVIGAKTKDELPFLSVTSRMIGSARVFPSTDDGSFGFRGVATQMAEELLRERKFTRIYSCGPEKMMRSLFELSLKFKIQVEFSLERIMKCGIAICGSCTIGDLVLCRDGPVLNSLQLKRVEKEFGKLHRDKTGTLCRI